MRGGGVAWGGNEPIGWPGAKRSVLEKVQRGMVTELGWSGEGGKEGVLFTRARGQRV